jgi:hypothetical protein
LPQKEQLHELRVLVSAEPFRLNNSAACQDTLTPYLASRSPDMVSCHG